MKTIKREYDPMHKEYIIRIPESLLNTKEGKDYLEETLLKGISDEAIVKEEMRRINHRNGDWIKEVGYEKNSDNGESNF